VFCAQTNKPKVSYLHSSAAAESAKTTNTPIAFYFDLGEPARNGLTTEK